MNKKTKNSMKTINRFLQEHNMDITSQSFLLRITKIWASTTPKVENAGNITSWIKQYEEKRAEVFQLEKETKKLIESSLGNTKETSLIQYLTQSLSGFRLSSEAMKLVINYLRNLMKKIKIPRRHSHGLTNKWLLEMAHQVVYRAGTHKGKTNWGDIQDLAKHLMANFPECKALLTPIVKQNRKSLKRKLNPSTTKGMLLQFKLGDFSPISIQKISNPE